MTSIAEFKPIPVDKVLISRLQEILANTKISERGCWERQSLHHSGYSYARVRSVRYPVHRLIKAVSVGFDPVGLVTDHTCRNPSCCNPQHLEFVTQGVNVKRGIGWYHFLGLKEKTHCAQGHSLDNCLIQMRNTGTIKRACRTCHMLRERKRRKIAREKRYGRSK